MMDAQHVDEPHAGGRPATANQRARRVAYCFD